MNPEEHGFYVYCIAEVGPAQSIASDGLPSAIEEDALLELITGGNLAAVASVVPLSSYGEDALSQNLDDPSWTAVRAMRHERVVEHFAKRISIVPLRFGTIYLERNRVEQMLSDRRAELSAILERIRDREEWGINVFSNRAKLMEAIEGLSSRLRQLTDEAQNASPGQAYLIQKKLEGLKSEEARSELARMVDEVEARISRVVDAAKRLRVLKVESTESGELKAKFAFLVKRSQFDSFRDAAEELANEMNGAGIRLELTGPWPAYNFADVR